MDVGVELDLCKACIGLSASTELGRASREQTWLTAGLTLASLRTVRSATVKLLTPMLLQPDGCEYAYIIPQVSMHFASPLACIRWNWLHNPEMSPLANPGLWMRYRST